MLDASRCYLCVRDQAADLAPVMPAGWTARREASGWYTITRSSDGLRILAWRANTNAAGTRALYALFAPLAVLEAVAAVEPLCAPARELWASALLGNAAAIAVVRRWPSWRFTGGERASARSGGQLVAVTDVVRRVLFVDGQTMPAPPMPTPAAPWRFDATGAFVGTDLASQIRIDSITRPALDASIASYVLNAVAEDEAPR
jgi:hypothetical protein